MQYWLKLYHELTFLSINKIIMISRYEAEIADLTDRINNLTESLDNQQRLYNKCKLGLQHLQKHYSMSTELITKNDL